MCEGPMHRLVGAPLMDLCYSVPVPGVCMYGRTFPTLHTPPATSPVGGAVPRDVGEIERR